MLKRQGLESLPFIFASLLVFAVASTLPTMANPNKNQQAFDVYSTPKHHKNGNDTPKGVGNIPKWSKYLDNNGNLKNLNRGFAFDLSSTRNNIHLGNKFFGNQQSIAIDVGGTQRTLTPGSAVTAAEYVAALQALGFGSQSLQLGSNGTAVGGSFTLNSISNAGKNIKAVELVVPTGVTGVGLFGQQSDFKLAGDLINGGSIYALSNKAGGTAKLGAQDIVNATGGLISSVVPNEVSSLYGGTVSELNLNLTAKRDLANLGTITSSGNLDLDAGKSLFNALPTGANGPQPVISAGKDVNITVGSGNVVNAGLINSDTGNINIGSSVPPQSLYVNNNAGTLQAIAGNINFRDPSYSFNGNITLLGGDLFSEEVNFNSGTGTADAAVNDVTGLVNVNAGCAHIGASTPNLQFGTLNLIGDPTFYNVGSGNNISIAAPAATSGADLAIIAGGDVTITSGTIDTTNGGGGNGGNLLIVAGANITAPASGSGSNDTTTTVTFANSSETGNGSISGGKIDLSGMTSITTNGTTSGNAGNITLIAYDGSGTNAGQINASVSISAKGVSGTNGQVTMIAGDTSGTSITTGSIDISGTAAGTGGITIAAATPEISGSGSISVINGAVQGGSGTLDPGTLQSAALSIGGLTINTGNLTFQTASSISVSSITGTIKNYVRTQDTFSSGFASVGVTGSITWMTFGNLTIGNNPLTAPAGLTLIAGGNITSNNAGISFSTGSGGNMTVIAGAAFTQDTSSVSITGASATGGNIDFSSPVNLNTSNGSGSGGDLTLIAFDGATNDGAIQTAFGTSISTGGSAGNANGDILVISDKAAAGSFSLGASMNTTGGTSGTGNIEIYNTTPDTSPNVVISKATGSITSGDPRGGSLSSSSITVGGITADGSTITIQSGADLSFLNQDIVPQGGGSRPDLHTTAVGKTTTGTGPTYTLDSWSILSGGDIELKNFATASGGITFVSGGKIFTNNGGISINTNGGGDAGDMIVIAGAAFTAGTSSVTITGASTAGGTIDCQSNQGTLATSASAGDGGNLTLIAFAGATNPGNILTNLGGTTGTGGSAGNSNGDLLIIAGRTTAGTAMQLGLINTEGGTSGTGSVEIYNRTPITSPNVIISTNNAGITQGDFRGGTLGGGDVSTSDIRADGVTITIQSGRDLIIGNQVHSTVVGGTAPDLHTSADRDTTTGFGTYTLDSWSSVSGGDIVLRNHGSIPGGITLIAGSNIFGQNSGINISTGSSTGDSGNFTIVAGAAFTEGTSSVTITGASTQGGKIDFRTSDVNIFSASGVGGGDGGDLTLIAFAGATNDGSVKTAAGNTMTTGGTSGNSNGDFLIVAGTTAATTAAQLGSINTKGGTSGTGEIEIYNRVPTTSPNVVISKGTGAVTSGDPRGGTLGGGDVSVTSITADGATITIQSGRDLSISSNVSAGGATAPDLHTSAVRDSSTSLGGTWTLNSWSATSGDDIILQSFISAPGGITLVAGSNIFGQNSGINISTGSSTGDSGNFTIVAGAAFTEGTSSVTITGASTQGGFIDFRTSEVVVRSSSSGGGADGGNMTLLAFAGATNDGSVKTSAGNSVTTGGTGFNLNGDLLIVAGTTTGTAVQTSQLNATGGLTGTGDIEIYNTQPNTSTALIVSTSTAAFTQGDPTGGTLGGGDVLTNSITVDGATMDVLAGRNVSLGALTASSTVTNGNAGTIIIEATGTQTLNVGGGGSNTISSITNNAGTATGNAGTLSLTNNGTTGLTLTSIPTGLPTNGDGRNILLDAGTGTLTIPSAINSNAAGTNKSGGDISLAAGDLSFAGNLLLVANGSGGGNGGTVSITTRDGSPTGDITIGSGTGEITATAIGPNGSMTFTAGGILTIAQGVAVQGTLGLNSDNVIINSGVTAQGGDINSFGQTVDGGAVTPMTFSNSGTVLANSGAITIASAPGQDLHIDGDGNGIFQGTDSNSMNFTATDNPSGNHPDLFFDASQTFQFTGTPFGTVNLTANGDLAAKIQVEAGVNLDFPTNNTTINVNTANFVLNGSLDLHNPPNTGTQLVINTPSFPGTIANSLGPLDLGYLGSNLVVHGGNLAFLSAGSIVNTAGTLTIDLSDAGGDGGNLTLIAGFSFTPGTGGVTVGPNAVDYALDATSATNGSIQLSNVNINTSGGDDGGSVLVATTGSVILGSINTTGGTGDGGDVTIIAQGVTVGDIDTTANTLSQSGAVSITSANIVQGAITVHVIDGVVSGGTFTAGAAAGNVVVGSINAGTADVDLSAANQIRSSGTITADSLSLTTAAPDGIIGGIGAEDMLTNVSTLTASTNSGVVLIRNSSSALDLEGPNSAEFFSVIQTNGSITISNVGDMPTGTNNLILEANGGTLSLPTNSISVAPISGVGGYVSLLGDTITWSGGGALSVDAQGTTSFGGEIFITTTGPQILSDTAGGFVLNARGTDGGLVNFVTDGNLQVDMSGTTGIKVTPTATNGSGGHISLTGATVVNSGGGTLDLNVDGAGTGNGGSISVTLTNSGGSISINVGDDFTLSAAGTNPGEIAFTTDGHLIVNPNAIDLSGGGVGNFSSGSLALTAGTMAPFSGSTLNLDLSAVSAGANGGSIFVELTNAAGPVTIGAGQEFTFAAGGLNGGTVRFLTNDDLVVDPAAIDVAPTSLNGQGGTIMLTGAMVSNFGGGLLTLNASANAASTGNGGTVGITLTGTPSAIIGTSLIPGSQYRLIANSGLLGGSGGAAIFVTNGDLVVNPAGISVNANVQGDGGVIVLESGQGAGPGELVINGPLSVLGKGTGTGGFISLTSNSPLPLQIGGSTIPSNGIFGTISALGKPNNGNISIENRGGDVSFLTPVLNVSTLSVDAAGNVTSAVALGGKLTQSVIIEADGFIQATSSKGVFTGVSFVGLTSGGTIDTAGGLPLFFNTAFLTVNADGNVVLQNKGKLALAVNSSTTTGSFNLTAGGPIIDGVLTNSSAIQAPSISLKAIKAGINGLSIDTDNLTLNGKGPMILTNVSEDPIALNSGIFASLNLTSYGDVEIAGNFGTTKSIVSITAAGSAGITYTSGTLNAGSLTMISIHSSAGTSQAPLSVNALNVTAFAQDVSVLDIAPAVILHNITATDGSISINTGALTKLVTVAGSGVTPPAFIHATNGSITIQNNNLLGSIVVGPRATILTDGTGGPVTLTIGAAPSNPAVGTEPILPGLNFNPAFGVAGPYFIPNPVTFVASPTTPISLNVIGAGKIILNSQPLLPKGITIKGGTNAVPTTITSDPPVSGAATPQALTLTGGSGTITPEALTVTAGSSTTAADVTEALQQTQLEQTQLQSPYSGAVTIASPITLNVSAGVLPVLNVSSANVLSVTTPSSSTQSITVFDPEQFEPVVQTNEVNTNEVIIDTGDDEDTFVADDTAHFSPVAAH